MGALAGAFRINMMRMNKNFTDKETLEAMKDKILLDALPDVTFDGWSWGVIEDAAVRAGYDKNRALAVFPDKLSDVLDHFADFVDRGMLERLSETVSTPEDLRVRDRVKFAVMARLEILEQWREAEKLALSYWSAPCHKVRAGRILWRTADRIWEWAGDTATDYNHYTKRGLLSGVIASTMLVWINDDSGTLAPSRAFLARRIDNVMQLGRFLGKIKKAG